MLRAPPRPAEERHSCAGGTAGEQSCRFPFYLNCRPDPRTLPGVGTSVYRSSSCALLDSAASRVSQGELPAGASQGNQERGQCQPRFGDQPTLVQALLGAAAFSPDVLNVSCPPVLPCRGCREELLA